jgi:L-2-hydroxycarboxylate dehydrogenase (NAD+)
MIFSGKRGVRSLSLLAASILSPFYLQQPTFCTSSHTYSQIPVASLKQSTLNALLKIGHSRPDAEIISDTLMYAELRGNNQGLVKLVTGALNVNPVAGEIKIVLDSPVSAKIDGGQRIGMVVVSECVDVAIEKAKKSGICVVACSNYSSATGALGIWSRKIAKEGLIGIVLSQTYEMVAPHGSYEPIFGTNPISVGIPTVPRPQVLDMATSAAALFGLKIAEKEGTSIANDVAYDSQGQPTTDPGEGLRGAIRVFDRTHKGSHIALMVELLAGALTGADMTDKEQGKNWGSLIIAIDPAILGSVEEFQQKAEEMCNRVKNAKKLPSSPSNAEIFLPGERGDLLETEQLKKGTVKVSDQLYQDILNMAKSQ